MCTHALGLASNSSLSRQKNELSREKTDTKQQTTEISPAANAKVEGAKIIVIDDDPFICETWAESVEDAEVSFYLSAEEFLEKLEGLKPLTNTFIVTDLFFEDSELNGLELSRIISEKLPDTPIFLSTATSHVDGDRSKLTAVIAKNQQATKI